MENPFEKKQLRNIPANDVKKTSVEVHPEAWRFMIFILFFEVGQH